MGAFRLRRAAAMLELNEACIISKSRLTIEDKVIRVSWGNSLQEKKRKKKR